jgi:hypothetical protein
MIHLWRACIMTHMPCSFSEADSCILALRKKKRNSADQSSINEKILARGKIM